MCWRGLLSEIEQAGRPPVREVQFELHPEAIERHILAVTNYISRGVNIRADALAAYREAELAYDLAYATAYSNSQASNHDKRKFAATLATIKERRTKDVAEVAWKRAESLGKAFELELGGTQSISKSVLATYGAAGTGER